MNHVPPLHERTDWDNHIQLVFSVLVAVALPQAFLFINQNNYTADSVLLFTMVFYIVLDNWYHLYSDMHLFDIDTRSEVVLYFLSLVAYACLPFLYGVSSATFETIGPPEWMLINLALICILDALRKATTVLKLRGKTLDASTRHLVGGYVLYAVSGFFYSTILIVITMVLSARQMDVTFRAGVVGGIWVLIRTLDLAVIPRVASAAYRITSGTSEGT